MASVEDDASTVGDSSGRLEHYSERNAGVRAERKR